MSQVNEKYFYFTIGFIYMEVFVVMFQIVDKTTLCCNQFLNLLVLFLLFSKLRAAVTFSRVLYSSFFFRSTDRSLQVMATA